MASSGFLSLVGSVSKLDPRNYYGWRFDLYLLLEQAEVWDVINGRTPRPNAAGALATWEKKSALGYRAIALTLSDSERKHIAGLAETSDRGPKAWESLKARYASSTTIARIEVKRRMINTRYDPDVGMAGYCGHLVECGDQLAAMGETIGEHEVEDFILANLPAEFASYGASLMLKGNLSAQELTNFLCDHERGLQGQETIGYSVASVRAEKAAAARAGNGSKGSTRERGKCYRCQQLGHKASECTAPSPVAGEVESGAAVMESASATQTRQPRRRGGHARTQAAAAGEARGYPEGPLLI